MTVSVLSPLQMDAGAGLLQNQGLEPSPTLFATIAEYEPVVTDLLSTISVGSGNILSNSVISSLQTLASNSCPALSDSVPASFAGSLTTLTNPPGVTGLLVTNANTYLGNGDLTIFAQGLSIAQSYVSQTNLFINTAVNSQTYLGNTFTSMNNMITGDVTQVNLATKAFGFDLKNLGVLIDLANLDALGSPLALIQRIVSATGSLPVLSLLLLAEGVDEDIVINLTDPSLSVVDSVQRLMYLAMTKITGTDLAQILKVLKITTVNIATMADLLNPVKLFPTSFQSLTVTTPNGSRAIYIDSLGNVNTKLISQLPAYVVASYERLQQIIPVDQALANKALGMALSQISGIEFNPLPFFANVVENLETTQDLPLISALTQAVPSSTANFYTNTLADGSGPNNTLLLTDILGSAIGWVSTDALGNTVAIFATLNLVNLELIYQTMLNTVNGTYTGPDTFDPLLFVTIIPPGLPAAGTYGPAATANETINLAISSGLIPAAQTEIGNIVATNPSQVTTLNQNWNNISNQLLLEKTLQTSADLNYANLTPNQTNSMYGFIFSLPDYGLDTTEGGAAQVVEGVADLTTLTGQAVVACLREGRNQQILNSGGIRTNSGVPSNPDPPPPQANLLPSTFSESEAAALVIK